MKGYTTSVAWESARMYVARVLLPAQVFFQTDEALVADDDVVDQLDVQDAPCRQELLRGLDILNIYMENIDTS